MINKKFIALLMTLLLVLSLAPVVNAAGPPMMNGPEPGEPTLYDGSMDLIAGKDLSVGEVIVTNDCDNIYVEYILDEDFSDEGWFFTEFHLSVVRNYDEFQMTKGGNPIPGQFEHKKYVDYEDEVTYYKFTVPYDFGCDFDCSDGPEINIAAHAVIELHECEEISGEVFPDLTWRRSSEDNVSNFEGYGAAWDPDDNGFTIDLTDELVWDGGTAGQNYIGYSTRSDVSWASWDYAASNPRGGNYVGSTDLRRFNAVFDLSEEIANNITSAILYNPDYEADEVIPINDNIYVFINEALIFWGGTRDDEAVGNLNEFEGMDGVPGIWISNPDDQGILDITDGWYIPGDFPTLGIDEFVSGENKLDVFTEENQNGGGMAELELALAYEYEECTVYSETAWGDGTRFVEQGNWGTWFVYELECPACDAPVLENGSFETPVVGTSQGWNIYPDGTTGLGWTVEWMDGSGEDYEDGHLELHNVGALGVTPKDGLQYAELDSDWDGPGESINNEAASISISQMINTCDYEEYVLTFSYYPRNSTSAMKVYWDGVEIGHYSNSNGLAEWHDIIIGGLAGSEDMDYTELRFEEVGPADSFGMFLDDVSVEFDE